MTVQNLTILGATGSIGRSTLDVVARHNKDYRIYALTANTNEDLLFEQCCQFRPVFAVLSQSDSASRLREKLRQANVVTQVLSGAKALEQVASLTEVDIVMAAIVGAAGLLPNLAAVKAGKKVLLANKESLVMAGALFMQAVKEHKATLLPIDSEHNAIFQVFPNSGAIADKQVRRILLTASGGPFRSAPIESFKNITPEQACNHPNWSMGRKISVDSATMLNKTLELIEACWLFSVPPEKVEIVIHPQSIVHSLVDYVDGSVLAQLGNPDMRTPIAYGLAWPNRIDSGVSPLQLAEIGALEFSKPCLKRFPILAMVGSVISAGGSATTLMNAANEVAVDAFLKGKILFTDIVNLIDDALQNIEIKTVNSIDEIIEADAYARRYVKATIDDF